MKKTGVLLFIVILFTILFPFISYAQEALKVGFWDMPPYQFKNERGELDGYLPELAAEIFKNLNIKYTSKLYPYARGQELIKEGEIDCLFIGSITTERKKFALFPEESCLVSHWGLWILKKNKDKLKYEKFEDLKGKRIGSVRGYYIYPELKKYIEENSKIRYVREEEINYKKLINDRVGYIYSEYNVGLWQAKKLSIPEENLHFISTRLFISCVSYPYFSKKIYEKNPEFIKKVSEAMKKIRLSGKKQELFDKWGLKEINYDYSKINWIYLP